MKFLQMRVVWGVLLLFVAGCGKPAPPKLQKPIVTFVIARPVAIDRQNSMPAYLGVIRGDKEIDLSFKLGGVLELIGPKSGSDWREGEEVEENSLLARLAQPAKAIPGHTEASQDLKLLAPFDGHVLVRMASSNETVSPGKPVLRFGDLRQMSIELGLPDTVVSKIKVGQEVPLKITTLEDAPFTGHVSEVGLAAKEASRLFKVVIKVANPQLRIRSGMTASVSFAEKEKGPSNPDAVVVPLSALVASTKPDAQERLAVFVVSDDGNVQERLVETDDIVGSSIVIANGMKAGEHVVTTGAGTLYDGAQVSARPAREP